MGRIQKKMLLLLGFGVMSVLTLTGCKASKKKVLSSTYYKELKKEKDKLKKENANLQKEIDAKDDLTANEQRASDYLDKISRDNIIKLEVGFSDDMDNSEIIEEDGVDTFATQLAKRADLTVKYTPDEVENKYGPGYQYILYDENNAVYEIMVFGGNYIVFTDLPNNVYYCYGANVLGDAFLHYKDGYPNSSLLHRLADTPLIISDTDRCYENDVAVKVANAIDAMDKTISSRDAARKQWSGKENENTDSSNADTDETETATTQESKGAEESTEFDTSKEPKSKVYTFYHHGNKMTLTVYDEFYSIENMDAKKTWYHASKEDIKALKQIFTDAANIQKQEAKEEAATQQEEDEPDVTSPSHSSAIDSDAGEE